MIALPSALALPWDCSNGDMCGMYVNLDVSYSQLQLAALVCGDQLLSPDSADMAQPPPPFCSSLRGNNLTGTLPEQFSNLKRATTM